MATYKKNKAIIDSISINSDWSEAKEFRNEIQKIKEEHEAKVQALFSSFKHKCIQQWDFEHVFTYTLSEKQVASMLREPQNKKIVEKFAKNYIDKSVEKIAPTKITKFFVEAMKFIMRRYYIQFKSEKALTLKALKGTDAYKQLAKCFNQILNKLAEKTPMTDISMFIESKNVSVLDSTKKELIRISNNECKEFHVNGVKNDADTEFMIHVE